MAKQNNLERLDDLYQFVALSEKLGKPFPEEYLTEITQLEEQLIKDEVLPLIHDNIEPTLRRVQRPLVLVVEYDPNGALKVNLSRKVNITAQISDAKEITTDPIVEHKERGPQKNPTKQRGSKTRMRVLFADGNIIENMDGADIFAEFVRIVGWQKVREMGLIMDGGPMVTNRKDPQRENDFREVANGWYLNTHRSNKDKRKIMLKIAQNLGIIIKVEIL